MPAYLQTWTEGVDAARERSGEQLDYAASNQYLGLGLGPGDRLFIVYLDDRRMHLIGRLIVSELIDRAEAVHRRGPDIYEKEWYAVADLDQADRFLFDLRVPDDIVRRLRFVRASGETTSLKPDSSGALDGKALQRIRRLTPESEALLGSIRDLESPLARPYGGRRPPKPERDAIEDRAMEVVSGHYVAEGWHVEDVHLERPYDLVCTKGSSERHVEVKGTKGEATAVELTRNEVTHAHTYDHPVLAVVDHIELRPGEPPSATGGELLPLWDPGKIEHGTLEPLKYSYTLPPR